MKHSRTALGLLALLLTLALSLPASAQDARTRQILDQVDDLFRSSSAHSVMRMTVKTEHYKRNLKMESWSKGKDKSLIRILEPRKESGTSTLKVDTNIYTYLPKTDRTIRLSSGMMQGSWMGSHFTNDDLVKESRMANDYTFKITFEGMRDGQNLIDITLTPKEEAAVTWGKITLTVRASDKLPVTQIYYDEDLKIARTMSFDKIKDLGGRSIPTRMRMIPAEDPDEFTEVIYESIEFDLNIKDSTFSKAKLKR